MVEETPEELLAELFVAAYFPEHSLGRPIEGTPATVSSFDHHRTANFHARAYAPRNLVIAAAGHVQHDQLVELVARAFAAAGAAAEGSADDVPGADGRRGADLIKRKKSRAGALSRETWT